MSIAGNSPTDSPFLGSSFHGIRWRSSGGLGENVAAGRLHGPGEGLVVANTNRCGTLSSHHSVPRLVSLPPPRNDRRGDNPGLDVEIHRAWYLRDRPAMG